MIVRGGGNTCLSKGSVVLPLGDITHDT